MRYGAIPLVTPVGGLVDTVTDIDTTTDGRGIVVEEVDGVSIAAGLFRAGRLLADRRRHEPLVRRVMGLDWSWREPAADYAAVYADVLAGTARNHPPQRPSRHARTASRK